MDYRHKPTKRGADWAPIEGPVSEPFDSQIGGHKPATLSGPHRDWLLARCKGADFTLRGLVTELAAERGLKVDYVSVWRFVHAEGLTHKKDAAGQRAGPS